MYQSFIYSPTDAKVSCLKKTILKFTLKQLRHVSVQLHHKGAHYLYLLKLQLLKQSIKILPNSATYIHQRGPNNIRSHITTVLTTH
jgi:hypothetical protein